MNMQQDIWIAELLLSNCPFCSCAQTITVSPLVIHHSS